MNPRGHRRYKDAARAWIASMNGQAVPCCICGQPCDTALPSTHPWGPTVEHQPPVRQLIADAEGNYQRAVALVANPQHWAGVAHRRCQNQQGQRATTTINRARNSLAGARLNGASRDW